MQNNFVDICRFVANVLGSRNDAMELEAKVKCWIPQGSTCKCYEDDTIIIVVATDSLAVHVVRKENNNPVLAVDFKGKCYRWHGEGYKLNNHLMLLLQKTNLEILKGWDQFNTIEDKRKSLLAELDAVRSGFSV